MTRPASSPTHHIPGSPHALSFGQAADLYDAARPSYPAEALTSAFGETPLDIVELGAGTGLLTRGLLAAGHRVTAVEPDDKMLDRLIASTQGLAGHHVATAEDIPLPDGCADAVTAGQAYHWFRPEIALPEIKRLLRPGGFFLAIWNIRDESVGWVSALSDIVGSSEAESLAIHLAAQLKAGELPFGPLFPDVELDIVRHEKPLDADGLLRLVQSRSYYLTADADRKSELMNGVKRLMAEHEQLAGRETFAMPYATYAFRAKTA
ncbi:class I SAM-dependent methyltransferase [Stackebrandtia nassauensis]|uniref:Methyltransferase type 11 n=1 Tax=Stackebrandtia nassauensis (strain DSM 44728 / CIP 108903 / NRRL B-16338 / NBRC 102104 / LLR-40K-21) TaxID=446470 RepID=D3Q441_STANL|nr:class I SAM-dependent methyltransferase [Stackebrandtia nassauensis]ADD45926.1 Methyltransferase type 11 [Stackebrandtia nassauensis DSM 44728]